MPTFLQLAQKVARESGTVSDGQLTTVVGRTGRLRKVVDWTNDGYRQIQNANRSWGWLQDNFEANTVAATSRYTGAALGLTRFAEWTCFHNPYDEDRFSIFDPAVGRTSEGALQFLDWDTFYTARLRGASTSGKPSYFSISPKGEIVLSPVPDAAYTLRGPYRQSPQELALDADVPEMPAHFHDTIVAAAVVMLSTHDEAAPNLALWQLRQLRDFSQLEREQLPRIGICGALA